MNFDRLKAFHQIALTGSFTKASRALFLTQPAVSQQVKALESQLGIILFDRSGKKALLTSEGEILFTYTDRLFQIYDEIKIHFGKLHDLETGKFTVGSTAVMGTYFLPKIIGGYNRKYPGIDINMQMGNSYSILNKLISNQVDLGFAGRLKADNRLKSILIHREKLLLVSSPDNPLTGKPSVNASELGATPFIWREVGTQTQALVKKWFQQKIGRSYPKRSIELQNIEAAKRTVIEGYGFTIIPEISIRRELHVGLLKRINLDGFELSFDYYLFYKKRKIFTTAIEAFIDILVKTRLLSHSDNLIGRVQKACD
ncbi:MAG: LysR family transcriptional regulator [Desulfobacterales bacterium]|nr:LysR family transcriptional regulator [Desulfobacterales bacterium]MDX2513007.1 LysR family transcriptional regulator [Desulfobacterales bacterium]